MQRDTLTRRLEVRNIATEFYRKSATTILFEEHGSSACYFEEPGSSKFESSHLREAVKSKVRNLWPFGSIRKPLLMHSPPHINSPTLPPQIHLKMIKSTHLGIVKTNVDSLMVFRLISKRLMQISLKSIVILKDMDRIKDYSQVTTAKHDQLSYRITKQVNDRLWESVLHTGLVRFQARR